MSRLEKRSDFLLSTLRKTVEAMGGNLSLVGNASLLIAERWMESSWSDSLA